MAQPNLAYIRTNGISGRLATSAALGDNTVYQWVFSSIGDSESSFASLRGEVGSPGVTAVPITAAGWLMMSGLMALFGMQRRRRNRH